MLSPLRYIGILCILLLTGCGVQFNPSHVAKYAEEACKDHGGVLFVSIGIANNLTLVHNKLVCRDMSVFYNESWFPVNPYRELTKREVTR